MPESVLHNEILKLLEAILAFWAARLPSAFVARNLAVRWDEQHPQWGVDPDVCLLVPAPPIPEELRSVCTWKDGHRPPVLAIEVVSETNPRKDYEVAPDKYFASGTQELCVFDPLLSGPSKDDGPFRLQVWRRENETSFVRTYAGEGPAYSKTLGAYLVLTDDRRRLRIADDPAGTRLWSTAEESERAAKDAERAAKDVERMAKEAERAAKEAALARIAELEKLVAAAPRGASSK